MRDVSEPWDLDESLRWLAARAATACERDKLVWSLDDIAAAKRVARELQPTHTDGEER
jgi:transcription initiation factor TFIIIB Brf1 subunit/transcription initiation factor TFIIB